MVAKDNYHIENVLKETLDKVSGLTDLLYGLSSSLELGIIFREESLTLLATILQGIEDNLKSVLQAE